jgi:hypothetical protein
MTPLHDGRRRRAMINGHAHAGAIWLLFRKHAQATLP